MATEKQIAANRRNAQLSTGPRSRDGKAISSRNWRVSRLCLLDAELAAEFEDLHRTLLDEYRPFGLVEAELVACIAGDFWRRRRATSLETALFDEASERASDLAELLPRAIEPGMPYRRSLHYAFANANNSGADFGKLARYLAVIDGSLHRNLQTLARLQARRGRRPLEDGGATAVETVAPGAPAGGEAVG